MKPGVTSLPVASMVRAAPSSMSGATRTPRPSLIPTSARKRSRPVPSTTAPPLTTTSNMANPRAIEPTRGPYSRHPAEAGPARTLARPPSPADRLLRGGGQLLEGVVEAVGQAPQVRDHLAARREAEVEGVDVAGAG